MTTLVKLRIPELRNSMEIRRYNHHWRSSRSMRDYWSEGRLEGTRISRGYFNITEDWTNSAKKPPHLDGCLPRQQRSLRTLTAYHHDRSRVKLRSSRNLSQYPIRKMVTSPTTPHRFPRRSYSLYQRPIYHEQRFIPYYVRHRSR